MFMEFHGFETFDIEGERWQPDTKYWHVEGKIDPSDRIRREAAPTIKIATTYYNHDIQYTHQWGQVYVHDASLPYGNIMHTRSRSLLERTVNLIACTYKVRREYYIEPIPHRNPLSLDTINSINMIVFKLCT